MIYIEKQIGETPLEALKQFRADNPSYENTRLSYAGRLDPMASGQLLLLEGEENDRREEFLNRDKKYEFEILFGASTDTFDLLGLTTKLELHDLRLTVNKIQDCLDVFVGTWEMRYPPYSSKTVAVGGEMIPLWKLARAGELPETLPTKEVQIYELVCSEVKMVTKSYITDYITRYIPRVVGDFRQEETLKRWRAILAEIPDDTAFPLASCRVSCSSGTYVRRLAQGMGEELGVPALAFSIRRTDI